MLKAANRDARYCYTKALAARERGLETKNPGSLIVDPMSRIIAGPMGAEEGILCADCYLELGIQLKLRHDFAGHYNRPDIFQLHVNRAAPSFITFTISRRTINFFTRPKTACRRRLLVWPPPTLNRATDILRGKQLGRVLINSPWRRFAHQRSASAKAANGRRSSASTLGSFRSAARHVPRRSRGYPAGHRRERP
jgi:hypothetical protein